MSKKKTETTMEKEATSNTAPASPSSSSSAVASAPSPASKADQTRALTRVVVVKDSGSPSLKTGVGAADFESAARIVEISTKLESIEEMASGQAALRATLGADLLMDLDELDRDALVYRLSNLSADLRERTKMEALRQHDAWRRAEVFAHGKYASLLEDQRAELEMRHQREVSCCRAEAELETILALNDAEATVRREDDTAAEVEKARLREYFHARLEREKSAAKGCASATRQEQVGRWLLEATAASEARRMQSHALALEAAMLGAALEEDKTSTGEASAVHRSAASALQASNSSVGSPSLVQLQTSFQTCHDACLKAAFVPRGFEGTSLGRFLGAALATLTLKVPPSTQWSDANPKLTVSYQGAGTAMAAEAGTPIATLAAARISMESGELAATVALMKQLDGPSSVESRDWLADASKTLAADRALIALTTAAAAPAS